MPSFFLFLFLMFEDASWKDKNTKSSLTHLVYDKFGTYLRILMFLQKANT